MFCSWNGWKEINSSKLQVQRILNGSLVLNGTSCRLTEKKNPNQFISIPMIDTIDYQSVLQNTSGQTYNPRYQHHFELNPLSYVILQSQ